MGWPLKFPSFQSAIVKPESVVLPVQDLQLIPIAIAENEEAIREGIGLNF